METNKTFKFHFSVIKHFYFLFLLLTSELLLSQEKSQFYSTEFSKLKPQNKPSGLLLGLKTDEGYRTLLITYKNGIAAVTADLPYLATPQKDGFYFIDEMWLDSSEVESPITNYDSTNVDSAIYCKTYCKLFVSKNMEQIQQFNKSKSYPNHFNCDAGGEDMTESVGYVIPNYISLNYSGGGYHTGGAHPFYGSASVSMNFDWFCNYRKYNDSEPRPPFSLSELYEKKRDFVNLDLFRQGENDSVTDGEGKLSPVDTARIEFSISRENGEVHLFCFGEAFVPYTVSGDYTYTASYDFGRLGKQYVANNLFPIKYKRIGEQNPFEDFHDHVMDIFISPSQDVVYLAISKPRNEGDFLICIDVKSQKEIMNLPFKYLSPSNIVMVEWATGSYVDKWKQILSK